MPGKFPVKRLQMKTKRVSTMDDSWAAIDKMLNDNPLSEVVTQNDGGFLPDFTRAVRMTRAIYRVNVPGYFYHHIKDPAKSASNKSGLYISPYPSLIDTFTFGAYEHACKSKGGSGLPTANFSFASSYLGKFAFFHSAVKGNTTVNIRDSSNAVAATLACRPVVGLDMRYSHPSVGLRKATYFENNAADGQAGVANNMIPIAPGQGKATTTLSNGTKPLLDTFSGVISGYTTRDAGKTSGTTNYDDGSSSSYKGDAVYVDVTTETGVFEGRGTYVYYYHTKPAYGDSDGAAHDDEYLFIPCKSVPTSVKPLTKIRDFFDSLHVGKLESNAAPDLDIALWHWCKDAFDDHSDKKVVLLKRVAEGGANGDATGSNTAAKKTVDGFRYKNWTSGKLKGTSTKPANQHRLAAFTGQTLKPRTTPFMVQRYYRLPGANWNARQAFPASSLAAEAVISSYSNIPFTKLLKVLQQYVRDYSVFNPVTDGETGGQVLTRRFTEQEGLTYG